ncbi:MAG: hypothetical protein ACR2MA_12080 [Egibacteraceae bacterium]
MASDPDFTVILHAPAGAALTLETLQNLEASAPHDRWRLVLVTSSPDPSMPLLLEALEDDVHVVEMPVDVTIEEVFRQGIDLAAENRTVVWLSPEARLQRGW